MKKIELQNSEIEIIGELPSDYWVPKTIDEWALMQKTSTALETWNEQQTQLRRQRTVYAGWIFSLISFQIIAIFVLVFLDGKEYLKLSDNIINILLPSAIAEIFGMGFIVVKYLFSNMNDSLIKKILDK